MTVLPRVHPTRCRTAVQGISGNSCNSNRICGSTTSTMEPASLRTYGQHRVKALQVFWPSEQGLFPEDDGWDLAEVQPVLA
jgi:hypothetical protein